MTEKEIIEVVAKLRRSEQKKRLYTAQHDHLKALLRLELEERGTDELQAGKFAVRKTAYTRAVLDAKKLQAELPKIYEQYATQQDVSRIEVVG